MSKTRRFRTNPATSRHARPAEAPQQPHAVTVPAAPAQGGYRYQLNWPEYLRRKAAEKRAQAEDLNSEVQDLIGRASRCCAEAEDMEHMALLIERDEAGAAPDAQPTPGAPMGTDELVNGWQTDFPQPVPESAAAGWDEPLPAPAEAVTQALSLDEIAAGGAR